MLDYEIQLYIIKALKLKLFRWKVYNHDVWYRTFVSLKVHSGYYQRNVILVRL